MYFIQIDKKENKGIMDRYKEEFYCVGIFLIGFMVGVIATIKLTH